MPGAEAERQAASRGGPGEEAAAAADGQEGSGRREPALRRGALEDEAGGLAEEVMQTGGHS